MAIDASQTAVIVSVIATLGSLGVGILTMRNSAAQAALSVEVRELSDCKTTLADAMAEIRTVRAMLESERTYTASLTAALLQGRAIPPRS